MYLTPQWDLLLAVLAINVGIVVAFFNRNSHAPTTNSTPSSFAVYQVFCAYLIGTSLFWLIWGGYSVDAWRYLTRFEHDPFGFENEQLFWLVGHTLSEIFPDPWPLKILSTLTALILGYIYFNYLRREPVEKLTICFLLLLATPAFYLMGGNAVRQGLSSAIALLAALYFFEKRLVLWIFFLVIAGLVHQFGVVYFFACFLVRFFSRYILLILLLSPFGGLIVDFGLNLMGTSLVSKLTYAESTSGLYHLAKFFVTFFICLLVYYTIWRDKPEAPDFRHLYIILVAISNVLLQYEVPYERLLLFSDFALPLAVFPLVLRFNLRMQYLGVSMIIVASLFLISSQSVVIALGYFS